MKTREDFYNDTLGAMRAMEEYWHNKGYQVSVYTNINGDDVCSVVIDEGGEEEHNEAEYIAVFERV